MESWVESCGKVAAGGAGQARWQLEEQVVSYLHVDKLGGITGEQDRLYYPGFQCMEIKPQNLPPKKKKKKKLCGLRCQEKLPASQGSSLEKPTE